MVVLASAARPAYQVDMLNVIGNPTNAVYRFRYRTGYVAHHKGKDNNLETFPAITIDKIREHIKAKGTVV